MVRVPLLPGKRHAFVNAILVGVGVSALLMTVFKVLPMFFLIAWTWAYREVFALRTWPPSAPYKVIHRSYLLTYMCKHKLRSDKKWMLWVWICVAKQVTYLIVNNWCVNDLPRLVPSILVHFVFTSLVYIAHLYSIVIQIILLRVILN